MVVTSIAWMESDFRPWAKLARDGSVGVWQLIPGDSPVVAARKRLRGCKVPKRLYPWKRLAWLRGMRGERCEDQKVADRRKKPGRFLKRELQDPVLSTYVFAYEVRAHIDNSIRRGWKARLIGGCKLPKKKQKELYRYGYFNSGMRKPRTYYVRKLCKRYLILRKEIGK